MRLEHEALRASPMEFPPEREAATASTAFGSNGQCHLMMSTRLLSIEEAELSDTNSGVQ